MVEQLLNSWQPIDKDIGDQWMKEVERRTGVHYVTLSRIRSGAHTNPRYQTMKTLEDYLKEQVA